MTASYRDDDRFVELLGLALRLEGDLEERIEALLEYVRVKVLDDCEAVLISQDQFDFEAKHLRLGKIKGAVRSDIDASIYKRLRDPLFLDQIDAAYPAWADTIIRDNEKRSGFWVCATQAEGGTDITRWRDERLHPVGIEDVWGATSYVDDGYFLTVLVPLHCGDQRPTPEQFNFIQKLPPVLAPLLMSSNLSDPHRKLKEGLEEGVEGLDGNLSEAQVRVLKLALGGFSEKEIAHRIHRSHHTVNSHLRTIYRHFNVTSRAELLALAIDRKRRAR